MNNVSRRWLEGEGQTDDLRTPDIDNMDYDEYHKSLTQYVVRAPLRVLTMA